VTTQARVLLKLVEGGSVEFGCVSAWGFLRHNREVYISGTHSYFLSGPQALILKLERDALIADVLRERLEKIVWHIDVVVPLHPEDLWTVTVQPFKPNSSLLKFLLSLKLMVNGRAQSEIGQVTSNQDDICLGKFLEVEGIVLAVNITDRQDSHSGIVVPGQTAC
jgi:hypothetical protein